MSPQAIDLVLLAAGGSSRMGRTKLLLPFGGTTLVRHAATQALASGLGPVIVVLGADRTRITNELAGLQLVLADNPAWNSGLSSSIRAGLRCVRPSTSAIILMIADQPSMNAEHLSALAACHMKERKGIVASGYGGARGVPALFSAHYIPELMNLSDDNGARSIIAAHPEDTDVVYLSGGEIDIDTADDHRSLDEA